MDFVVSKVAMALCALMVAGVLSGCMDPASYADPALELKGIVEGFCDLVDRTVLTRSKCSIVWKVPCLSDGLEVTFTICSSMAVAEANGERFIGQPVTGVHTWCEPCRSLNASTLEVLDKTSEVVVAASGDELLLVTEQVLLDDDPAFLAFVRMLG